MDLQRGVTITHAVALRHTQAKTMAGLELRAEDSTTSKELGSPQDQVNGTTNDESSPQSSPKRKPSVPRRGQGGSCEDGLVSLATPSLTREGLVKLSCATWMASMM